MSNNEALALGRRAVACKGWRWLEGMGRVKDEHGDIPDLRDPDPQDPEALLRLLDQIRTMERMLELVQDAWNEPDLWSLPWSGGWMVCGLDHGMDAIVADALGAQDSDLVDWRGRGHGRTEAEALVAALESAP